MDSISQVLPQVSIKPSEDLSKTPNVIDNIVCEVQYSNKRKKIFDDSEKFKKKKIFYIPQLDNMIPTTYIEYNGYVLPLYKLGKK